MQHERSTLALHRETRPWCAIVCALFFVCLSQTALAQSGRRPVKQDTPPPTTTVETKAEPVVTRPAINTPPIATLIISGDRTSAEFDIPIGYLDFAINACIERLRKAIALEVSAGGTNLSKSEAVDLAKKQTSSHVVWLDLKVENDNTGMGGIIVQYFVFIPESAKVKNFGRVYADRAQLGTGPMGVGLPRSTSKRAPLDYLMKQAGRDIAERLIGIFQVSLRD